MNTSIGTSERRPAARIFSTSPRRRKISMLRALQRSIFGRNCGASFCSIRMQRTPRRPRSYASVRPTGPAPTIRTSVFTMRAALNSFRSILSSFDDYLSVAHERRIGLHRFEARRENHLAGAHVELPLVKVALDDLAIQQPLRQRAGPMGAAIVRHVIGS